MKVDLNGADASSLSSVTSTQHSQVAASGAPATEADPQLGEDKATLSSDSTSVTALTAKAMESSEVRQDKIDALRQAIQNGTYKLEPKEIAEAMIRQSE